ncbi:hypothetical protein KCA24_30900, partial [Escherichia coli]|nr:hypothetical protein [Escherichia coli]
MPLLVIRNLTIVFQTGDARGKVVDRVSMTLSEGEISGLVGETVSGKVLIAVFYKKRTLPPSLAGLSLV